MAFQLPKLPYNYNALEPHIDARTMEIHYSKHHQGYVNKLNAALKDSQWENETDIVSLLKNVKELPQNIQQAVINNGGGHANHSLFWTIIEPNKQPLPDGKLAASIAKTFKTFDEFKEKFINTAVSHFGSGWAWLCKNDGGEVSVFSTANQDSPIMQGYTPILGIDVWEHAYYLKYKNLRPDYVNAFWELINWQQVGQYYNN